MTTAPIWLFDLDNTLHDASAHIFPHINRSMTAYLQAHLGLTEAEANALRKRYWHRYGATLQGLVRHHGTDPHHFLAETHRFEALQGMLVFEHALKTRLRRLPGRKLVFSNGPEAYARRVLRLMGIRQQFEDVFGLERLGFCPKPQPEAFKRVLAELRVPASRCILVEDSAVNLRTAKRLGMRTVWVSRNSHRPAWVDVQISNILAVRRALGRTRAVGGQD